jgi:hypothetical protein
MADDITPHIPIDQRGDPAVLVRLSNTRRARSETGASHFGDGQFDLEEVLLLVVGGRLAARSAVGQRDGCGENAGLRYHEKVDFEPRDAVAVVSESKLSLGELSSKLNRKRPATPSLVQTTFRLALNDYPRVIYGKAFISGAFDPYTDAGGRVPKRLDSER